MITGTVTLEGVPIVSLAIAGQSWEGVIDTGFNGDLELPESIRPFVNAQLVGQIRSLLGGGQVILEDAFLVDFPFDGEILHVQATFAPVSDILIGTHLLQSYRLEIDFAQQTVLLERAQAEVDRSSV